jgi:uncharacterized membrane protein
MPGDVSVIHRIVCGGQRLAPVSLGRKLALGFVFSWFVLGGIAHFAFTGLEMQIIPDWVPWPRLAVLVSGACELLGAAGLLSSAARPAAGNALVLLTLAVTPANIYMLQHAERFPIPYWILVARLPAQAGLLCLIYWSTRVPGRAPPGTQP